MCRVMAMFCAHSSPLKSSTLNKAWFASSHTIRATATRDGESSPMKMYNATDRVFCGPHRRSNNPMNRSRVMVSIRVRARCAVPVETGPSGLTYVDPGCLGLRRDPRSTRPPHAYEGVAGFGWPGKIFPITSWWRGSFAGSFLFPPELASVLLLNYGQRLRTSGTRLSLSPEAI